MCCRCICNGELADAIKSHGKIFVHNGAAGGTEPPSMTVDSIRSEFADHASALADSADRGFVPVKSVSSRSTPTKSKPVFSVMTDEMRARPHTKTKPPSVDTDLSKRGTGYFFIINYALRYVIQVTTCLENLEVSGI